MSEQNFAKLIRSCIDGEGEPGQDELLRQRANDDEDLDARIRFEKALRERVGRTMRNQVPSAPEGLAAQIRSTLADADQTEGVAGKIGDAGNGSSQIHISDQSRRSSQRGFRWTRPLAIAAVLAIVVGAVSFSIFGPQFDPGPSALWVDTADFTSNIHARCEIEPKLLADKTYWMTRGEAARQLADHLAVNSVEVASLDEFGYAFHGAGRCMVPGVDYSGHMVFERPATTDAPEAMVSMFVAPNVDQYPELPLGEVTEDWMKMPAGPDCVYQPWGVCDGSVAYFLVCTDAEDLATIKRAVAEALRLER